MENLSWDDKIALFDGNDDAHFREGILFFDFSIGISVFAGKCDINEEKWDFCEKTARLGIKV